MSDNGTAEPGGGTTPEPGGTAGGPGAAGGGTETCSVPEAARRLGISERAVRKRIDAGTLAAEKEGRAWVVRLPTAGDAPTAADPSTGQPATTAPTTTDPAAVAVLRDLLHDERERADRYMTAAALWQERARGLEEQLKQLTAGDVIAGEAPEAPATVDPENVVPFHPSVAAWRERTTRAVDVDRPPESAPWWRFWGRRR